MSTVKFCECGCGNETQIIKKTVTNKGRFAGQYSRFISGHNGRMKTKDYIVDESTGCWNWNGSLSSGIGYGRIMRNMKVTPIHRYLYEKITGIKVPSDKEMDHLCRNPRCVNPAHLEIVSRTENMRRRPCVKLSHGKVHHIRELYKLGRSQRSLAQIYKVNQATISSVVNNKIWRDL